MKKGKAEHYYNTFAPFARAQGIYVIALLLACFSWLRMSRMLTDTAFYLIGLAFLLHTAGLAFRMYLEGRPPVTNLYSSAVFVGWGAVILGWIVECIYRKGIGSCVAALVGFSTLIIAGALSEEGDTMAKLVAVLDTNFWLATHVVCITLGYSATFLAGFLGMIYVLRGVFTPSLTNETAKSLARMVYGIVCFATIFSFVGTVLGGIWADQSWGRFWGWDPKENGALLIVVWNAIILHCRWGGIVRDRGLMNLAIFGNIVTAWSWFGVNMLGSGLHSYGFMDGAFHALEWFAVGQVLLILAAVQPLRHWLSGRHIAKEFNCTIAIIVAVLMGLGIMLHVGSLWGSGFLSYLGLALVCAGLLLSFLPSRVVGTTEKRAA
jgi:ABC-type transport system involved in cytochrome c biogenesis permease subunit